MVVDSLQLECDIQRLLNILGDRRLQRTRDDEEVVSLIFLAEYRNPLQLFAFNLPTNDHAVFQESVRGQQGVAAFGQETGVMLRRYFDHYLQGPRLYLKARNLKE